MTAPLLQPTLPSTLPSKQPSTPEVLTGAEVLVGSLPTPAGPLSVAVTAAGVVRAAGFGDRDVLVGRLRLADPAVASGAVPLREVAAEELPTSLRDAVVRYADGDAGALDGVPVEQPGGPFFQDVWDAMRRVPPGSTVSYAELAAMAGRPTAVRAAGSACARNLVAPFVPCHRIVRTDGTLGGYAYGLDAKRALLAHERQATD